MGKITGKIKLRGPSRLGQNGGGGSNFAYVQQSDNLLNTATVRETFETAAKLRMPRITNEQLKVSESSVAVLA